jgi:hypothetical protein
LKDVWDEKRRLARIERTGPSDWFFIQKNKSSKVKQQVAQIQKQTSQAGKNKDAIAKEREKELRAQEKAAEEKRKKEEAQLFKPVQVQKVPFGVGWPLLLDVISFCNF